MSTPRKKRRWLPPEVIAFLAAVAVILTGSWAADELRDWLGGLAGRTGFGGSAWWAIPALGLMLVSMWGLYSLRRVWIHPRTRLQQDNTPPAYPHVVMFLSQLSATGTGTGVPQGVELSGDLDADLRLLEGLKKPPPEGRNIRWPWEMSLRGLAHHRHALKSVVLVCSEQSLAQAAWFGALLRRTYAQAFPRLKAVRVLLRRDEADIDLTPCPDQAPSPPECKEGGWDFEAFDQLSAGLARLLDRLRGEGLPEQRIVIDITGGQKVSSVVGAAITMNRQVTSQYVRTNEPHQVIHYDLVLTPMDEWEA